MLQPRSANNSSVRSTSVAPLIPPLAAGSINKFGKALKSKCEIEDPGSAGSGENILTRPWLSPPCRRVKSTTSAALTPEANSALMASPSALEILTDGMVMLPVSPLIPMVPRPSVLAIMTAVAPASCANCTFTVKLQSSRSIRAILLLISAVLISGSHASFGLIPPVSTANTTLPLKFCGVAAGPKLAVPNTRLLIPAVDSISTVCSASNTLAAVAVTLGPVQTNSPGLVVAALLSALVGWSMIDNPLALSNKKVEKIPNSPKDGAPVD